MDSQHAVEENDDKFSVQSKCEEAIGSVMWNCCLVVKQGRLAEAIHKGMRHHVANPFTRPYSLCLVCHRFGLTGKAGSSYENLPIGPVEAFLPEYGRTDRRANAKVSVKAMTDGETHARDMASPSINHIPLATSEDLRWGMLWLVLVCVRGSRRLPCYAMAA
jgi:hypothetical protein